MAKFLAGLKHGVTFVLAFVRGRAAKSVPAAPVSARPYPWEASYPPGLAWDAEILARTVCELLDEAVARWAARPCLEFLGRRYSYAEVGALVDKAAKGFQTLGVKPGVRVGLFLPNSTYYVISYHAVLKAGGTVVNFNPLYAEREIARQIRDSETRIMVTMNLNTLYPKIARRLDDSGLETIVICSMGGALSLAKRALFMLFKRREVSSIPADSRHVPFARLIGNGGKPEPVELEPESDIAVLQYTGGTTGLPKGAMLSHANLAANTLQTRLWTREIRPGEEKVLAVLPLFHVFGMTGVMNVGLVCGAEIVLLPRFKLAETLTVIDREKPSVLLAVPTIYSAINEAKDRESFDLSSLRYCISGGAPLSLAIRTKFESLTGCRLVEGYGLTEAGPVCTINPSQGPDKPNSAGLPLPRTLVEIVSLEDPEIVLPPGETGEICITGPQVMLGYWRRPEESAAVLKNGRLRTGDVGYLDAEGYLYIIDRIKDLIISGGYNVYPRMVEEAIYLHPAIAEVAVCGVPDRHRGEIVKAFVRLRDGMALTGAELRGFLKERLASFEVPRAVEFVEAIPKTLVGKPLRRALVERERARLEGRERDEVKQSGQAA
ncbi:MAG TPA: long-chain fatty acid--CoA ligase [Kiloniellales bacterium]|nr:long-chain fatty acid--CoA ligase [Kiloniellales bacterium]